jgi:mRNA-degrading endonuclease YafQ of YafQ-DinJ toxin-antitoxin module
MDLARVVMVRLIHGQPLDAVHRDHPLKGEWARHREFDE